MHILIALRTIIVVGQEFIVAATKLPVMILVADGPLYMAGVDMLHNFQP